MPNPTGVNDMRCEGDAAMNSSQSVINASAADIGGALRWLQLWLMCADVRVFVDRIGDRAQSAKIVVWRLIGGSLRLPSWK